MTTNSLSAGMQWKEVAIGVGAAAGALTIRIGSIGQGKPAALITAGIHGDEGPWGAWAIRKLLDQNSAGS